MKALWICVVFILLPIFSKADYGYSPLTTFCKSWTCINEKLQLPATLPPRDQYRKVLRTLLPEGWSDSILDQVLETCYNNRTRAYTNTCPGQSIMHCVVDNMIQNCPESIERKEDACTPVSSIVGFKYMFSQSRYKDLEEHLPKEHRPAWFLKNYFDSKCCDLQPLLNSSILKECEMSEFIHYYDQRPNYNKSFISFVSYKNESTQPQHLPPSHDVPKPLINFPYIKKESTQPQHLPPSHDVPKPLINFPYTKESQPQHLPPSDEPLLHFPYIKTQYATQNAVKIENPVASTIFMENVDIKNLDPLDCCDMAGFINPLWRSECDFALTWDNQNRLSIRREISNTTDVPTSTPTNEEPTRNDVKIVPLSCESNTCVFNQLHILSPTGDVNLDSYTKLLDNFTEAHPEFNKAKARAITECMKKPLLGYDEECQINKVLACTFDVLSEYCPYTDRKHDPCKDPKSNMMCQISSSQVRPKSRRSFCSLPNFVSTDALKKCGVVSLSHMKYVTQRASKKHLRSRPVSLGVNLGCHPMTAPTSCLLNKMGIMSKYKFMDYFKMKEHIKLFSSHPDWSALSDVYISAFTNKPMYRDQCNSPKQLLNVVDTMLMTCPLSHRRQTQQCNRFYQETMTSPYTQNQSKAKIEQLVDHFSFILRPAVNKPTNKPIYKPLYQYGILASGSVPPVSLIDVKPKRVKKPLIILPVYMRLHKEGARYPIGNSTGFGSPLLRSGPLGRSLGTPAKPNMI